MKGYTRRFGILVVAIMVAISFAVTGVEAAPAVKEWKIPFLIFLSGPYAGFGKQLKWAADEAVKEINDAGGIAGKPIVIEYHDTALDPSKAVAEMSKVVRKSLLIFGPIAANTTKASMPLVVREKSFAMAVACGTGVNLEFQPYTVHFISRYEDIIPQPIGGWLRKNPDIKSAVQFVWPLDSTWMEIARIQKDSLKRAGIEVFSDVECSEGVDMASVVVKAMAKKPDGFVITVGPVEAGKIVRELDKRGAKDKGKVLFFATAMDPALFEVGGQYVDGAYHWNSIDFGSKTPRWQSLYGRFKKVFPEFPQPTIGVPMFYDMVYMAKEAIESTGVTGDPARLKEERDKIRNYCRGVRDFRGVMYDFNMVDGIAHTPSYLFQIKNTELVPIDVYPPK